MKHWVYQNLTHMADWEVSDLTSFKWARDKTTVHMTHFITKLMSNILSIMMILQNWGHATTNLCPFCVLVPETIYNLYQCTQERIHGRWTASVDSLWKWLMARNTDPEITTHLVDTFLYIAEEIIDLLQFPNITLHSDILQIVCTSIILGFIPTSLVCTQQTYFTHIGRKNKTRVVQTTHHRNLETHIWPMDTLQ